MNHWTMEIPGPIMGAVRTTQRQKRVDPTYRRYESYKSSVRAIANTKGFPDTLDPTQRYGLTIQVFSKARATADLSNQIKGIEDALLKQDKRILSIRAWTREHSGEEKAIITLSCLSKKPSAKTLTTQESALE